jgi:hypothetical protein
MATRFEGNILEDWILHFNLNKYKDYLKSSVGISELMELKEVYEDEETMETIKSQMDLIHFRRFRNASSLTAAFGEMPSLRSVTSLPPRAPGPTSLTTGLFPPAPPSPSTSTITITARTSTSSSSSTSMTETGATTIRELEDKIEKKKKSIDKSGGGGKGGGETASTATTKEATIIRLKKELEELERTERILEKSKRAMAEKVEKTKAKKKLLTGLDERLKEASSLDLCFLLDLTGSMAGHMTATKNEIQTLVNSLPTVYPDIPIRLAFVGYRDHCDGSQRISIAPFGKVGEVGQFKTKLAGEPATGGGDGPEDVMGGLEEILKLEWRSATKMLIHIADAPCHGSRFHSMGDDYPAGDPRGLTPESLLPRIREKNVLYLFGRINTHTDQMITIFNSVLEGNYIETLNVSDASKMMSTISKSVTTTMSSTLSSSCRTKETEAIDIPIDEADPNWALVPRLSVHKYPAVIPASLERLMAEDDLEPTPCLEVEPIAVRMQVAPSPFAKGACRLAYKARDAGADVVHKAFCSARSSAKTRTKYEDSCIRTHVAAIFFAREFNRAVSSTSISSKPSIRFADIHLLCYLQVKDTPFCVQEERLEGNWEKYNNNAGMVGPSPTKYGTNHSIVQAFSHWTFHVSSKKMMVVDCQGVFDAATNSFILTDPAIQCKEVIRFGDTNLGQKGMERFCQTHRCNEYCLALGLPAATV